MPLPLETEGRAALRSLGMEYFTLPSMVGISSSAPSTACVKVMGASHSTLVPSRRKISCGRTAMTISRSPAGPPFLPALPLPAQGDGLPVVNARGNGDLERLAAAELAVAVTGLAGLVDDPALAAAAPQGAEVDMKPSGVWRRCCTMPVPRQSGQTSAVVPFFAAGAAAGVALLDALDADLLFRSRRQPPQS